MPELPEVETVKRGLEPVLLQSTLSQVILNRSNLRFPFPDNMKERLEGQIILGLNRRGKYILINLQSGESLVVHLGMSGSYKINPTQSVKHDHVIFKTNKGDTIVYNDPRRFGYMFFVKTGEEHKDKSFSLMGVEPLGNKFHGAYLLKKLTSRKIPIKSSLLDQRIIAGIGNIYACEALYMSRIDPRRQSQSLTLKECDDLANAIKEVLNAAIESGGSSLRDHRQTDGSMGYFQHGFKVYDREGLKCLETGAPIERIIQSGRSTFFCPVHQK